MKYTLCLMAIFFFFVASLFFRVPFSLSDELDDLNKKIGDLTSALNMSINATKPLETELNRMQTELADIKARINYLEQDIVVKRKNIDDGYKTLAKQEKILGKAIRNFYIKSYYNSPFLALLSASSATEITQILAYQKAATDQDKIIITNIALSIQDLEIKKRNLEDEQARLSQAKATLDQQSEKLNTIVSGAKAYQATLNSQIAQLSTQQQQLISQRLGSLNIPRSAGGGAPACIDDRNVDPGFSPGFAFFTYGVPNRVGLSQYGAWGRAKAGQDSTQILQAYYSYDSISGANQSTQIHVTGSGVDWTGSLEEYVKRIYEVPDSWGIQGGMEALKAQAIAARSYALAYTNNGQGSICASDQCQVFKPDPKGGNWEQAVNATTGQIMVKDGNPIKAWFSSTHGGYTHSSSDIGWGGTSFTKNAKDTTTDSINSFDDLKNNAYDGPSHANSSWFYCDWGSRANKTAWLKSDEIADIVNVILLARADSSTKDHFYQTDKPHPYGGEVWNEDRVKSELRSRNITPFNSISNISIGADFGSGKTTSVNTTGDAGSASFSASEFKDWFNLRAPANIQIVGPLFNPEKR